MYDARSDDKIGPCKSAGYLTGRRTILERYRRPPPIFDPLPCPRHRRRRRPSFTRLHRGEVTAVLPPSRLSPRRASRSFARASTQFFITSCSPNDLFHLPLLYSFSPPSRRPLFSFFFSFFFFHRFTRRGTAGSRVPPGPRPEITKARTRLTRYRSPNKYALISQ